MECGPSDQDEVPHGLYPGLDPKPEAKPSCVEGAKALPTQPLVVDISNKKLVNTPSFDQADKCCKSGSTDYSFATPRTFQTMSSLTIGTPRSSLSTPSHYNNHFACIVGNTSHSIPENSSSPSNLVNSSIEVFVGDLSFFCREYDLYDLFSRFGYVLKTRIKRSERDSRTLMYGFVVMQKLEEAQRAVEALHGYRFLGRDIRVELSKVKDGATSTNTTVQSSATSTSGTSHGPEFQVHVAFTSFFNYPDIVKPRETLLRSIFEVAGLVKDVALKEYSIYKDMSKQEGFCFVSFFTIEDAGRAVEMIDRKMFHGFIFGCTLSYHNPADMHLKGHIDYRTSLSSDGNRKYDRYDKVQNYDNNSAPQTSVSDNLQANNVGNVSTTVPPGCGIISSEFSSSSIYGNDGMMYSAPQQIPGPVQPYSSPAYHPIMAQNPPPPQPAQSVGISYIPLQQAPVLYHQGPYPMPPAPPFGFVPSPEFGYRAQLTYSTQQSPSHYTPVSTNATPIQNQSPTTYPLSMPFGNFTTDGVRNGQLLPPNSPMIPLLFSTATSSSMMAMPSYHNGYVSNRVVRQVSSTSQAMQQDNLIHNSPDSSSNSNYRL